MVTKLTKCQRDLNYLLKENRLLRSALAEAQSYIDINIEDVIHKKEMQKAVSKWVKSIEGATTKKLRYYLTKVDKEFINNNNNININDFIEERNLSYSAVRNYVSQKDGIYADRGYIFKQESKTI